MTLILSHAFVEVDDPDAALGFYRDVLGFEVRNDVRMGDFRWLTVSPATQPEVEIVLNPVGAGRPADDAQTLRTLMAKGSLAGLVFRTDDVDAIFEKIRASGAEVMQEPIDQPYGVRDCAFRDPAGNNLRFSQELKG